MIVMIMFLTMTRLRSSGTESSLKIKTEKGATYIWYLAINSNNLR